MASNASRLLDFMMLIGRLKALKRTGWVLRGVHEPETVASHMYRMSIMAFLADTKQGLDKNRCVKLSLVHDMAECLVGDIVPSDNISKDEKHRREKEAMQTITDHVGSEVKEEIFSLWEEYEEQSSQEAKFVKDLDKFDMILQAYQYEQSEQKPRFLQEFFDSTQGKFQTPQVKEWVSELEKRRNSSDKVENITEPEPKKTKTGDS